MSELDKEPFPRAALIAAASVVGFSLIATTVARVVGIHFVAAPASSAPAQSVDLRFVDQPNGSVSVRDGGRRPPNRLPGPRYERFRARRRAWSGA